MDYINLIGAEDVRSAGNTINSAAQDMRNAANQMSGEVENLRRIADDFLVRLEALLKPEGSMTAREIERAAIQRTREAIRDAILKEQDKHRNTYEENSWIRYCAEIAMTTEIKE